MIDRAALRLQSSTLSGDRITELAGVKPSSLSRKGDPVSSRQPDGPVRTVTTWIMDLTFNEATLTSVVVDAVSEILPRLAEIEDEVTRDLVLLATARELGSLVEFDPTLIEALARHRCGIVLDIWPPSALDPEV